MPGPTTTVATLRRVNAEQDKENMVTLVLRAYAEKRGLQYADWA